MFDEESREGYALPKNTSAAVHHKRWTHLLAALAASTIGFAPTTLAAPAPAGTGPLRLASARLTGMDMGTPSIGYAYGYMDGRFALWRTSDGGTAWTRYAVPGAPRANDPSAIPPTLSFLGPQTGWMAWIVPNKKSSTLTVLRTTTGGRLWRRSVTTIARAMSMVEQIDFTSAQNGWIRAFSGGEMMQGDTDIFRTTNQGASWTLMSAASGYIPNSNATPKALPELDEPMPMTFTNANDGWAAVGNLVVATASASLYHTTDAGARWHQIALTVPKPYDRYATIGYAPVFSGAIGTVLMQYQGLSNHLIAYGTTNGGTTWTIKSALALSKSQYDLQSSFINPNRGWIIDDAATRFATTANGGRTWSSIRVTGVLRSATERGYRVVNLQMNNDVTGWILLQQVNGMTSAVQSRLLKTTDGGATWVTELTSHGTIPA